MSDFGITQQHLSTIDMDGKPCAVSVRIAYDGIEYIGRLFFADPQTGEGIPDHGAIPGRTVEEAIDMAFDLQPDIITLDNILPDMIGTDILRVYTKEKLVSKVIMISAVGQESVIQEGLSLGAKAYIVKPFTSDQLLNEVNKL